MAAGLAEPEAMALATATPDGVPSVRFVLLKGIDERGVEFFTNYESRKGRELAPNPRAALAILWKPLQRQVRLEGPVEVLDAEESDAYFAIALARLAARRLGVARSREVIPDREWLEARLAERRRAATRARSRARRTGAASASCRTAIEFWEGRPNRLHDREAFRRVDGEWVARASRLVARSRSRRRRPSSFSRRQRSTLALARYGVSAAGPTPQQPPTTGSRRRSTRLAAASTSWSAAS